jgi:type II secretory pathway pseudopilin PulG
VQAAVARGHREGYSQRVLRKGAARDLPVRRVAARAVGAFTLIELLATVAVILLLLSILASAIGHARQRAIRVLCINNLRQLYALSVGFAGGNDGVLPQGLSENPAQFSARTNYTNFAALNDYMKTDGYPPSLWYCPARPRGQFGDETAWGDAAYGGSGKPGSTGTPGEFPIGYFYTGNLTPGALWKFDAAPPRTLDGLMRTNAPIAWDYCRAARPSPVPAVEVSAWQIFPHYGVLNPAVCQYLISNGSVQSKHITEMSQRFHYIAPAEVYW